MSVGITEQGSREYRDIANDAETVKEGENRNQVEERGLEVQLVVIDHVQGHQVTQNKYQSFITYLIRKLM